MRALIALAVGILLLALPGCGGHKDTMTVESDGKKATVTTDQGGKQATTTVETPEGKASAGSGVQVSEAELGMPTYPGATNQNGVKVDTNDGQSFTVTCETADSVSKVMDFYKSKLPGAKSFQMAGGDNETAMLIKEEGKNVYHVQAQKNAGRVTVTLMHVVKK